MSETTVARGPIHMELKINDFWSDAAFAVESEHFLLYDAKWHIQLCGSEDLTMSLDLVKFSSPSDYYLVAFTVGIKQNNGPVLNLKYEAREFGGKRSRKVLAVIDRDALWETMLFPDDSVTILFTIRFMDDDLVAETATQTTAEGQSLWVKNLKDLLLSERATDVTIKVKEREFHAHQVILATQSTVFAAMFQQKMAEQRNGVVDIEDCEADSFAEFLLYIYTGEVDHVTSDNAPNLYRLADKYDTKHLKSHCVHCMNRFLSIDSFCDVAVLAATHDDSELLRMATDFFFRNAKAMFQSEKWPLFMTEQPSLATELLNKLTDKS